MASYETVLVERSGGVETITLNRPEVLNSFNATMHRELHDALRAAERDAAVRCVVLTGAGRGFCAGQDLKDTLAGAAPADGAAEPGSGVGQLADVLRQRYNPIIRRLRTMEKPVVAAVNGVAAGAGVSVALACDLILAADSARFILAFSKVGLVPDSGASWFLPRVLGFARAYELAVLAEPLSAEDARGLGLINRVVPAAELAGAAAELAQRLAAGPTRAFGLTKRAMNRALTTDLDAALEYEALLQGIAAATADAAEGVRAFVEKRPPQFSGK